VWNPVGSEAPPPRVRRRPGNRRNYLANLSQGFRLDLTTSRPLISGCGREECPITPHKSRCRVSAVPFLDFTMTPELRRSVRHLLQVAEIEGEKKEDER